MRLLVGPFSQIVTMEGLPKRGPLQDDQLHIIENGALLLENGQIVAVGPFDDFLEVEAERLLLEGPSVCMPGIIDCHTHICHAGNRSHEYAMKLSGMSYQEIAKRGGGISSSVEATRKAGFEELLALLLKRADALLSRGVTTCEVKSGYGLNKEAEIKMLEVIQRADQIHPLSFIPTCLAAHIKPKEFESTSGYLQYLVKELLPTVRYDLGVKRVDIFVEKGAFGIQESKEYLLQAKAMGFSLVIHGDQFSSGGSALAVELGALSVDHLEHSTQEDIDRLARSDVIAVALPGASLGLAEPYAPARKLLDHNLSLVMASDWNPGSAPMGDLLVQSALLGMKEKLTMAETLAAITCRAAEALGLSDRGILKEGRKADFIVFPTSDYRDILYYQGSMKPIFVCKEGNVVHSARQISYEVLC